MTNPNDTSRRCPTRADGAEVLIAHTIPVITCQERQRRLYHKCFTCVHQGAGARAPLAPLRRLAQDKEPGKGEKPAPIASFG